MDCDGRPVCGVCTEYTDEQKKNGINMGFSYYPIVNKKCTVNNRYLPIFFVTILDNKKINVKYFNKDAEKEVDIVVEPRNEGYMDSQRDSYLYDVPIENKQGKTYEEIMSISKAYFS